MAPGSEKLERVSDGALPTWKPPCLSWTYVAFSELGFNKGPRASRPGNSEGLASEIWENDAGIGEVSWYGGVGQKYPRR